MTAKAADRLILEMTQHDDWPAVMKQLQQCMRTDDPLLDALFEHFAKVTPRSNREIQIKTYLLIASMRVLALSQLNAFGDNQREGVLPIIPLSSLIQ